MLKKLLEKPRKMKWHQRVRQLWLLDTALVLTAVLLLSGFTTLRQSMRAAYDRALSSLRIRFATETTDSGIVAEKTVFEYGSGSVEVSSLVVSHTGNLQVVGPKTIDTSRLGETQVTYRLTTVSSLGELVSWEVPRTYLVADTEAPVISLRENALTIAQGSEFDPLANIASVIDGHDGYLIYSEEGGKGTFTVNSTVRTSGIGSYQVDVTATDESGNTAVSSYSVAVRPQWTGVRLSAARGAIYGPQGKETYYNLDMSVIVAVMRGLGFDAQSYPYWIRDDGCKMLGDYVMVAANYATFPKGSLVETSVGTGIVCDTGGFAQRDPQQLDIATNW